MNKISLDPRSVSQAPLIVVLISRENVGGIRMYDLLEQIFCPYMFLFRWEKGMISGFCMIEILGVFCILIRYWKSRKKWTKVGGLVVHGLLPSALGGLESYGYALGRAATSTLLS